MSDELTVPRIRTWMTLYVVTPRMLADGLGYCPAHVRKILNGKARLMPETHQRILTYFQARKAEHQRQVAIIHDLDQCA